MSAKKCVPSPPSKLRVVLAECHVRLSIPLTAVFPAAVILPSAPTVKFGICVAEP